MDVEDRFRGLRRELRRSLPLIVIGTAVIHVALLLGQAQPAQKDVPGEIKGTKFTLVDEQGNARATIAMENGGPAIVLTDSRGKGVIRLQVPKVPDKAGIYLIDPVESTDAELAMTMNGPVLHFNDKAGNRIRLATNELNAPLAAVYDAEGKKVFEVTGKK